MRTTTAAMTKENAKAELCYAYVHAVSAAARVECVSAGRHSDNMGVDVHLFSRGQAQIESTEIRKRAQINVQLKATAVAPRVINGAYAHSLNSVGLYNEFCDPSPHVPAIVVVLYLPACECDWLVHTDVAMSLRRCAYWASLRGAPPSRNKVRKTIYIPRTQPFNPDLLRMLMDRAARGNFPTYEERMV